MYLDPQHWQKGSGLNVFTCFRGRAILSSCGQSASGQLMVSSPLHRYSCVPTMLYRAGHVATFYCSFATTTPRQRNRALLASKNMKNYKASVSKQSSYNDIVQNSQLLLPENMFTMSRQCCRVPSSAVLDLSVAHDSLCLFYAKSRMLNVNTILKLELLILIFIVFN